MRNLQKIKYLFIGMVVTLVAAMVFNPVLAEMVEKQISVLTGVNVYLDDQLFEMKDANGNAVEAFVHNGTTYLPVRAVSQAVGLPIVWEGGINSVFIGKHTPADKQIKVLSIGNSFSDDAQRYIHAIAAADGVDLLVANLYIGGCSIETHWKNASGDLKEYVYKVNSKAEGGKVSIKEILEKEDWDYVTFQQASALSGTPDSYYPFIEDLAKYVLELEPKAEFLIHQTWAYQTGNDTLKSKYANDPKTMYDAVDIAYKQAAQKVGEIVNKDKKPLRILPAGAAVQYARAYPAFDDMGGESLKLFRDRHHLSYAHGRYLAGAVWYQALTGKSIVKNSFKVDGISDEELKVLKESANKAVLEYGWTVEP